MIGWLKKQIMVGYLKLMLGTLIFLQLVPAWSLSCLPYRVAYENKGVISNCFDLYQLQLTWLP